MNNNPILEAIDELNKKDFEDCIELDSEDDDDIINEEDVQFEKAMFEFFAELCDEHELTEDFKNEKAVQVHYSNHCLANKSDRVSTKYNVYYDFNDVNKYSAREQLIVNEARSSGTIHIDSLLDSNAVLKAFRKLFEGGVTLVFSALCCIRDKNGTVITITLHSFATDVTKNYENNTIDYMITRGGKTRTLFPLDAYYVENKFNNVVKRTFPELHFNINH